MIEVYGRDCDFLIYLSNFFAQRKLTSQLPFWQEKCCHPTEVATFQEKVLCAEVNLVYCSRTRANGPEDKTTEDARRQESTLTGHVGLTLVSVGYGNVCS